MLLMMMLMIMSMINMMMMMAMPLMMMMMMMVMRMVMMMMVMMMRMMMMMRMINTRSCTQGRLSVHPGSRTRSDCSLVIRICRDEDDDHYEMQKIMIISWRWI